MDDAWVIVEPAKFAVFWLFGCIYGMAPNNAVRLGSVLLLVALAWIWG
jgi:hypothetical protein